MNNVGTMPTAETSLMVIERTDEETNNTGRNSWRNCATGVTKYVLGDDLSNQQNLKTYNIYLTADALGVMAIYVPFAFLPACAEASGLSHSAASWLTVAIGLGSCVGRLLAGFLFDGFWTPLKRTTTAIFIATVSSFLIAIFIDLAPTYQGILITACAFLGLSSGLWISTAPQVLMSLLGESHFEKAFSLMTFMRGVASVITQPFAGQMEEVTELPNLPLYLAAIYFALSAIALFIGTRQQEEEQREEDLQVP